VKKLAARIVGSKSFEETARELVPNSFAMPRHRAIADARRTARILYACSVPCLITGGHKSGTRSRNKI